MSRNDAVQSIQGNRNVFIDDPTLAWSLFGQELPAGMQTPTGKVEGAPNETVCRLGYGHRYVAVGTVSTCAEDGYTTYTCETCGESYVDNIIPAHGHSYIDGVCVNCNDVDPDLPAPTPPVCEAFVKVNSIEEGNEVIIVCAARNMALSGNYNGYYNNPVDGKITTDDATIVWTVGKEAVCF